MSWRNGKRTLNAWTAASVFGALSVCSSYRNEGLTSGNSLRGNGGGNLNKDLCWTSSDWVAGEEEKARWASRTGVVVARPVERVRKADVVMVDFLERPRQFARKTGRSMCGGMM